MITAPPPSETEKFFYIPTGERAYYNSAVRFCYMRPPRVGASSMIRRSKINYAYIAETPYYRLFGLIHPYERSQRPIQLIIDRQSSNLFSKVRSPKVNGAAPGCVLFHPATPIVTV